MRCWVAKSEKLVRVKFTTHVVAPFTMVERGRDELFEHVENIILKNPVEFNEMCMVEEFHPETGEAWDWDDVPSHFREDWEEEHGTP